jgi:hypothetical protein
VRFLSRGRAFTPAELGALTADPPLTGADYQRGARARERDVVLVVDAAQACQIPVRRADVAPG